MSLEEILSNGHTFAGVNAASQDCINGIRLLQDLKSIAWCRQAHDWFKFPTADMMHSIDKKFGGRLTKVWMVQPCLANSYCIGAHWCVHSQWELQHRLSSFQLIAFADDKHLSVC